MVIQRHLVWLFCSVVASDLGSSAQFAHVRGPGQLTVNEWVKMVIGPVGISASRQS
jgi:hypothetical protein